MKLLHLGDLHLGKTLCDFDLKNDQRYILDQIIQIISQERIDVVLISGDVYDKSIPSEAATQLLDYFLVELSKLSVYVFMISGNHDSEERLNYASRLLEKNNIYIEGRYQGELCKYILSDEYGDINFYLLPFVKASSVRHYHKEEQIESYEDAVRLVLSQVDINHDHRNVILAHQFVAGKCDDPVFAGSEKSAKQSVGLVEKVGYNCFDDFDYVALGHIHSPQSVGRPEARYAGSPLKYSLSEASNEKSVPIITLKEKGKVDIKLYPLKPMRDLRHIKGKMSDLLSSDHIEDVNDFIYATLTDEEIVSNVMGIFQQVYPNTLKIDYVNSHTKAIEQVDISHLSENRSFEELIDDFYKMVYGCEMNEEEKCLIMNVAKEAGVLNETD